jgi:hypothetical protein
MDVIPPGVMQMGRMCGNPARKAALGWPMLHAGVAHWQ